MLGPPVNRDLYGGILFIAIGALVAMQGAGYGIGSLQHLGAGFFPMILGVALSGIGILIAAAGVLARANGTEAIESIGAPEWRGFAAIVCGVLSFIFVGKYFGLAPAAFSCVFISAFGDRASTLKGSVVLALTVPIFAVWLFAFMLKVQFPVFQFPISGGN
jgi:hypothetical protein